MTAIGTVAHEGYEASLAIRSSKAEIKRRIRRSEITLRELLNDPPEVIHPVLLYDVLQWQPYFGKQRLRAVNAAAMKAGINLALDVGSASRRTLEWVAGNGRVYGGLLAS